MQINQQVAQAVDPSLMTHEGAPAAVVGLEAQLRRSVMACMLWEDTFYESGVDIAARIEQLVAQVPAAAVASIAIEARTKMKLRHAPLLLARTMARLPTHKHLVGALLPEIIQRADELSEFLAIYWKGQQARKKSPLSAQVKKGLAKAFARFSEYDLAKYNRKDAPIKLRDVMFLCHAKPGDSERELLYKKLANKQLETPDTWEVALSAGADKKETFERLMVEGKLGALAFLRNLRNMQQAGVAEDLVIGYSLQVNLSRVLPFRFIAAARHVPLWEPMIEGMMLRALGDAEKLPGKTALIVDNSGSMYDTRVSAKSELDRSDAACALAILLREICEECVIIAFATSPTIVPARRGFALRDAIKGTERGGTNTEYAISAANQLGYQRIIVITDEQSHQKISGPTGRWAYFINVAPYKNGIGYGAWTHIDGWSEAIIDYIRAVEMPN